VIDELGNGRLRVVAIDFEHAFEWGQDEKSIVLPKSRGLRRNIDTRVISDTLNIIERLDAERILSCCTSSGHPSGKQIAEVLQRRQGFLRAP
jgi:hypothetical protein